MRQISDMQLDIFRELVNIGIGKSAHVLNSVVGSHIKLSVPDLQFLSAKELEEIIEDQSSDQLTSVKLTFDGS